MWHSAGSGYGADRLMIFSGAPAAATGENFGQCASRSYSSDTNLQFLSPPGFPSIDDAYATALFREAAPRVRRSHSTASALVPIALV